MFSGVKRKQIVGLAVTPNLGLEACIFDTATNKVVKYGRKFLEYNIASKEIQDPSAFRSTLSDLFNELGIQKDRTNCYVVLPNVYFGFHTFDDPNVSDETIDSMILSQASQSYVFKSEEPISSWASLDDPIKPDSFSKLIAYSSIQRRVVDTIQDVMMDEGVEIVGIESAVSAIPRGVAMTGVCKDLIDNNQDWDILVINQNGYTISQMKGGRILDYVESPFAVMSFDGEEVYPALASAIGQYLPEYPAKRLVVISNTDIVSADRLRNEIVFDDDIIAFESNKFGESPIVNLGLEVVEKLACSMSLSVIGASVPKIKNFATINVLGNVNYDGLIEYGSVTLLGRTIPINSNTIPKFSIILSALLLVLGLLIFGLLEAANATIQAKIKDTDTKIQAINNEITEMENKVKDSIANVILQIMEDNVTVLKYYDSLATDIPANVWLDYYTNIGGTKVGIEGYSMDIRGIYDYFKSLKLLSPSSEIKLNKLEIVKSKEGGDMNVAENIFGQDGKPRVYYFEISNTTYEKQFDDLGNSKVNFTAKQTKAEENAENAEGQENPDAAPPPEGGEAQAAKIPNVPDVEINLKEIR